MRIEGSLRVIALVAVCILASFSIWVPSVLGKEKTFKLTYSHFWPVGNTVTNLIGDWGKEVEKRTNGRVSIVAYPGSMLTPPDKCYDGIVKGISSMGTAALSYTRGRFPLMEALDLPLGYKNATVATNLSNEVYKKFHPRELDDVKIMYFMAHGPGIFFTRRPVRSLEDMKDMKIRCTGLGTKIVLALGGIPVAMPMAETYDALSKGVVEGTTAPSAGLVGFKWGEVVKYCIENYGSAYTTTFFVAMNKNTWNSMPADIQKTIAAINEEWIPKAGKCWDDYDKSGREYAHKVGVQDIRLSSEEDRRWANQVKVTMDSYVAATKKKNLPGDEVLQFCYDYLRKNQ
jgi:TRAP-type C4-dicarboxylate transport system substrate-binding protein